MRLFSIHPHKGYLNTPITISSDIKGKLEIFDNISNEIMSVDGSPTSFKFAPGVHNLRCEYNGLVQEETIIIEDAIKLGGSTVKRSFVSEKSPWCIVVMADRTYFYNRETKDTYLEFSFVPREGRFISRDLILFESENVYSLYSFSERKPIQVFSTRPIFISEQYIVMTPMGGEVNEYMRIYSSISGMELIQYRSSDCMVDSQKEVLYSYCDTKITMIDLRGNLSEKSIIVKERFRGFFANNCYILENGYTSKIMSVISLETGKILDSVSTLRFSPYLVNSRKYPDNLDVSAEFDKVIARLKTLGSKIESSLEIGCKAVSLEIFQLNNEKIIFYVTTDSYFLNEHGGKMSDKSRRLIYGDNHEEYVVCRDEDVKCYNDYIVVEHKNKTFIAFDGFNRYKDNFYKVVSLGEESFYAKENEEGGISLYHWDGTLFFAWEKSLLDNKENFERFKRFGLLLNSSGDKHSFILPIGKGNCFEIIKTFTNQTLTSKERFNHLLIDVSQNTATYVLSNGRLIPLSIPDYNCINGFSENCCFYISKLRDRIILSTMVDDNGSLSYFDEEILKETFDVSSFKNPILTDDGYHFLYSDNENTYWLYDFATGNKIPFESNYHIEPINGYRPYVNLDSKRHPVIINPVTMQSIPSEYLSKFKFVDPNGCYWVDSTNSNAVDRVGHVKYRHKFDNTFLSKQDFSLLDSEYNIRPLTNLKSDTPKYHNRIQYAAKYPLYFVAAIKNYLLNSRFSSVVIDETLIRKFASDSSLLSILEREAMDYYFCFTASFTDAFIDVQEYVRIVASQADTVLDISVGKPLLYVNYISFSSDSRYVCIVGRYPNETYSDGERPYKIGGLLLLCDLIENKEIIKSTNTAALWICAFSKTGYLATYESVKEYPISYFYPLTSDHDTNKQEIITIKNRNFLCFSPSGKYFALSNQGYRLYDGTRSDWGHLPSTHVYLRSMENPYEDCYPPLDDHGSNIDGLSSETVKTVKTVAMVAFSKDDKYLLSASDDGVVVIRNLHLD